MRCTRRTQSVVIIVVSGSGKSTVGRLLAERIDSKFCDGDDLHSDGNIARMAAGHALGGAERLPWLRSVGKNRADAREYDASLVVACSALKRSYPQIVDEFLAKTLQVGESSLTALSNTRHSAWSSN